MLRILKAFVWLRWRTLVNSLERTGSRDRLERFSIAIEKLGPILAAILLIPSALLLGGMGVVAGWTLVGNPESPTVFTLARYLLYAVPPFAIVGPILLPAADRTNPIRLLLLPIHRHVLYVAQSASAFGDPWTLLALPLAFGIGIGLAAAGALTAAVVTLLAAALLILIVVGLSALTTSVVHLVVRNRRRGELAALIFIVIIPMVAMLPGLLGSGSKRQRGQPREPFLPAWASTAAARAAVAYPPEMFAAGARAASSGEYGQAAVRLAGLAVTTVLLHGIGLLAFRRVLDSPGSTSARRTGPMRAAWGWRLPALTSGASAVASAQFRLALRTPRGRSILLSPLIMFVIFGMLVYRAGAMDFGAMRLSSGISLATFTSAVSLLAVLPIAMNQFAVDRAGLTMTLLAPLTDREILSGKAVGIALTVAPPVLVTLLVSLLVFPVGSILNWITLVLGVVSVYLLGAPVAAMCSAVFPRVVDMNSIGSRSNAHGAAGLIGFFTYLAAAVPPALLTFVALTLLDRPALAPVFVLIWCALAYAVSRMLFGVAARVFAGRRENLAMI